MGVINSVCARFQPLAFEIKNRLCYLEPNKKEDLYAELPANKTCMFTDRYSSSDSFLYIVKFAISRG